MKEYEGRRIRLISMGDDPDPIPPGSTGTVKSAHRWYDTQYCLSIDWDPEVGRSLALICPPDKVELIDEQENKT